MKRYWIVIVLLLAGLGSHAHASGACQGFLVESAMSPGNPTETEMQVLQQAAPELEMSYQELYNKFQNGEATIEQNEDADWVVTVYVSGGVLIAILADEI